MNGELGGMRLLHGYQDRGHGHGTHAICTEDGSPLEMTAENVEEVVRRWNNSWASDDGKTHWETCWTEHYRCAMRLIDELTERNRMLSDVALSAVALKLNIEHGFPPVLDALNRDLGAFQRRFGGVVEMVGKAAVAMDEVSNGDVAQAAEHSLDKREAGSSSDPVTTTSEPGELEQLRKENDTMRKLIAESDMDCLYCGLKKVDMARCELGFPGCGRADDLTG